MAVNIDRDVIQADWLRIIARMRLLRRNRRDASEAELRLTAEREQLAGVPPVEPSI